MIDLIGKYIYYLQTTVLSQYLYLLHNTHSQQVPPVMSTALDYRQILQQLHIQRIDQKHLSFNK